MHPTPDDPGPDFAWGTLSGDRLKSLLPFVSGVSAEDALSLADLLFQRSRVRDDRAGLPAEPNAELARMLKEAADPDYESSDPHLAFDHAVLTGAVIILGGPAIIGAAMKSDADVLAAINRGFPAGVLRELRLAGIPDKVLAKAIAPSRTLMRRATMNQRLSRRESDAAWRLASGMAMASHVLNGPGAALSWLGRPKAIFADLSGFDLLETSLGEARVKKVLRSLHWGDPV